MRHRFHTLDVFTDRVFGGNPLAVFPDARGLSAEQMQATARELNLSETVFVLPPEDPAHTRRLRIFTPRMELPFAGHPTVGTAFLLAALGHFDVSGEETRVVFEEGAGPVPVLVRAEDGRPRFAQLSAAQAPETGPEPPAADVLAAMLGLEPGDLLGGAFAAQAVSAGVPFLCIPLVNRDALRRARLDVARWQDALAGHWAPHVYPICFDPELAGSDVRVRMFSPPMGIAEDPATGAAAAALGGYLGAREAAEDGTFGWVVEQGMEMGRPSLLHVEADKRGGRVTAVRVGGSSVLVGEGEMEIP